MKTFLKVLLGLIVGALAIVGIAIWATSGIADVGKQQIALISQGKVEEAYNTYSSKEFKAATTLEAFKAYVAAHKELSENKDVTFNQRAVKSDGTGTLEGTLTSKDGTTMTVKYSLVKEGNDWKIINMDFPQAGIAATKTQVREAPSIITTIAMSDAADKNGVVAKTDNKTTFKTTTKEIFVSVYLKGAASKDTVTAGIMHIATQSVVGPASNDTGNGGDQASQFSFTKPTAGWPTGYYKFKVTLGNGEYKEATFKVE